MTLFYFHIRDRTTFIPDDEGMELRDLRAAHAEARMTAIEWLAADPRGGTVEITDRNGVILDKISMRGALH